MTYLVPELELKQVFQQPSWSSLSHSFTIRAYCTPGLVVETEGTMMYKTEFRFSGSWNVVHTKVMGVRVLDSDRLTFETRLPYLPTPL